MSRLFCLLTCLGAVCFFCGCDRPEKTGVSVPVSSSVLPGEGYKRRALNAAGGLQSWQEINDIKLHCIVTIYNADGTYYLTEQVHRISPWSKSIEVSGREPAGAIELKLTDNQFEKFETAAGGWFSEKTNAQYFCSAVLDITTAPVLLLENKFMPAGGRELAEIDGSIYQPFYRITRKGLVEPERVIDYITEDKLYLNQESFLVDMIQYGSIVESDLIVVKGFYYRQVSGNIRLPGRIEIYSADSDGTLERLLVKIECVQG